MTVSMSAFMQSAIARPARDGAASDFSISWARSWASRSMRLRWV